jgi:hypothetical protein
MKPLLKITPVAKLTEQNPKKAKEITPRAGAARGGTRV